MTLIWNGLLFLTLLVPGVLLAASGASNSDPHQRIVTATEKFHAVIQRNPEEEVIATAYFATGMPVEEIRQSLHQVALTVKGFLHGTPSHSGGYTLNPGETVEQALSNYQRDHLHFLQMRMEMEDKMIASEQDQGVRAALIAHRQEAEQVKADVEQRGLRLIGVEFHGKARAIMEFKERNRFVRVVELKESGKPQPAVLPAR